MRLKDILQMSSGVHFNENYGDFFSDINRFSQSMALGTSLDDFTRSLARQRERRSYYHFVSIYTQVLGMVLTRASNRSLIDYLQEKIWHPLAWNKRPSD